MYYQIVYQRIVNIKLIYRKKSLNIRMPYSLDLRNKRFRDHAIRNVRLEETYY